MNCPECKDWLQKKWDGDTTSIPAAVEQHWGDCPSCREQSLAAQRVLDGLLQLSRPSLAPDFSRRMTVKVLQDRRQRQAKLRRRVGATLALAASILLLLFAGYAWMPSTPPHEQPMPSTPVVKVQPKNVPQEAKVTPKKLPTPEPRNALAALTDRWVDTTRDQAKVVLVATNLDTVEKLPALQELPPLDPSVREAGEEVSEGVRAVTRNARRAFDFFTRELPMPEAEPQRN